MPLTRAAVESSLVGTLGGKLAFVGKSTARDGTNPDLAIPIATAAVTLGVRPVDFAAIADDEVAAVANVPALLGLAQLFALREIWGCMTDVTEATQSRSVQWSAMSAEIQARIAALEALYATLLQAHAPLVAGVLTVRTAGDRRAWRRGGCEF